MRSQQKEKLAIGTRSQEKIQIVDNFSLIHQSITTK